MKEILKRFEMFFTGFSENREFLKKRFYKGTRFSFKNSFVFLHCGSLLRIQIRDSTASTVHVA